MKKGFLLGILVTLGLATSASADPIDTLRKNPGTVVGCAVGSLYGGTAGCAIGGGAGAVIDNQGKHIDPGPAIDRGAQRIEKQIRSWF